MTKRKIVVAERRGFCAGVERAIGIVEESLRENGAPVCVRHDIVHNEHVVESFKRRGVLFIEDLNDAVPGRPLIFSAHGVSPEVEKKADELGLVCVDATCPIVKSIHKEADNLKSQGYFVFLIGHANHPETIGTLGHLKEAGAVVETINDIESPAISAEPRKTAYLTQTTLSPDDVGEIVAALENRFPDIKHPSKSCVCYATLERQRAVVELTKACRTILVIGSPESSNSNRLREVAKKAGADAYLIRSKDDIPETVLHSNAPVGVTAGASAPEHLVEEVVATLERKQQIS